MVVTASYGLANSAAIITTAEVTGSCTITPQPLIDGTTYVTISYSENGTTVTTTQSITVTHKLQSIVITTNPSKTTYEYGDTLVTTGMVVTATYSDNRTATVNGTCSPTSLTKVGTQTITVTYSENGVTKTASFNVTVERKSVTKPTWKSNLTYSGSPQSVNNTSRWNNFNTSYMSIGGTTSATNAGTYTATFTLGANYRWSDKTTAPLNVNWTINKATGSLSLDKTTVAINASNYSSGVQVTITRAGDGVISYSPTSISGLTLSLNGNILTIKGNGSTAVSATNITISVAAGTNYTAPTSKTISVSAAYWSFGAGTGEAADSAWFTGLKNYLASNSGSSLKTSSGGNILGATKTVTLTTSVLGTTSHLIRVIGVDQDANNTVTFQTKNCLNEYTTWSTTAYNSSNTTAAMWTDANCKAKKECINYYNAFPGKSAIKTIKKGTCPSTNDSRNGTPTYNDETVFLLSEREFGLDSYSSLSTANSTTSKAECTQGKNFAYAYYTSNTARIMGKGDNSSAGNDGYPWERSRYCESSSYYPTYVCSVDDNGTASYYRYNGSSGLAPAFVIGN